MSHNTSECMSGLCVVGSMTHISSYRCELVPIDKAEPTNRLLKVLLDVKICLTCLGY